MSTDPKKDFALLVEFLLNQAEHAPVKTRIPVYRALANLLGDTPAAKQLSELANELEVLEQQFREFAFSFERPSKHTLTGNGHTQAK